VSKFPDDLAISARWSARFLEITRKRLRFA